MYKNSPMLNHEPFQDRIKQILKDKFERDADAEIERLCAEFRKSLELEKTKVSAKFVEAIDVFAEYDLAGDRYTINITFNK